jgi:hypothetical protein
MEAKSVLTPIFLVEQYHSYLNRRLYSLVRRPIMEAEIAPARNSTFKCESRRYTPPSVSLQSTYPSPLNHGIRSRYIPTWNERTELVDFLFRVVSYNTPCKPLLDWSFRACNPEDAVTADRVTAHVAGDNKDTALISTTGNFIWAIFYAFRATQAQNYDPSQDDHTV